MTILMDKFEQSDLEKETNDSHNTFYQNAIHYKERENALLKELQVWYILSCLCDKTRADIWLRSLQYEFRKQTRA